MIRTRFAPSPTGFMHLGNLRTALYAYLIAKSQNGTLLLRIEDTDTNRFVPGALDFIYRALEVVGIQYDEGPGKEGPFGPYIQSQRKDIYLKHAKELIKKGHAYYCFCAKEKVQDEREDDKQQHFRCNCPNLNKDEIDRSLTGKYIIRQIIPKGITTFNDIVFGEITVDNSELENQILIKTDGMPTYNFANVVDDYLMKITHVIRGTEYLSSTPKYNLLYTSFGWDIPTYIHLPHILNENKQKLSKRKGDANFEDLLEEGYLPEAVINYIALLGWSPSFNQEIFSLNDLKQYFQISGLSKSPAVFDKVKLTWFNSEYIKSMDFLSFYNLALPYLKKSIKKEVDLNKVARYTQSRINFIKEVSNLVDFIDNLPEYSTNLYVHKKMKTTEQSSLFALENIIPVLQKLEVFDKEVLQDSINRKIKELEIKNSAMLWPIRTALSGKETSFCGAIELLELLGYDESLKRISIGIKKLKDSTSPPSS